MGKAVPVDAAGAERHQAVCLCLLLGRVGDVQVEEACQYLYERGVVAYPYTTETPVEVLGAKYKWARSAGLLGK